MIADDSRIEAHPLNVVLVMDVVDLLRGAGPCLGLVVQPQFLQFPGAVGHPERDEIALYGRTGITPDQRRVAFKTAVGEQLDLIGTREGDIVPRLVREGRFFKGRPGELFGRDRRNPLVEKGERDIEGVTIFPLLKVGEPVAVGIGVEARRVVLLDRLFKELGVELLARPILVVHPQLVAADPDENAGMVPILFDRLSEPLAVGLHRRFRVGPLRNIRPPA